MGKRGVGKVLGVRLVTGFGLVGNLDELNRRDPKLPSASPGKATLKPCRTQDPEVGMSFVV